MPTDLFGGDPNFGADDAQQPAAPRDLFGGNPNYGAENVRQQTSSPSPSPDLNDGWHLNSLGRHLLANAGSAAQNTEKNMNMPGINKFFPEVPNFGGRNENLYNDLGIKKGILDSVSEGAMEYAPFGAGAAKLIKLGGQTFPKFAQFMQKNPLYAGSALENSIAGAGYGGANDGKSGAVTGAAIGAISPFPAAAANAGGKYIAEKVAQSAIPGLTKRATDYMSNLAAPNGYAKSLYDRFSTMFDKNKSAWGDVKQSASSLDKNITKELPVSPVFQNVGQKTVGYKELPGQPTMTGQDYSAQPSSGKVTGSDPYTGAPEFKYPDEYSSPVSVGQPNANMASNRMSASQAATGYQDAAGAPVMENRIDFNASPYHNYIDNYINKIQGMEPAKKQQYSQALALAGKAKELAPQSFSGTVAARQNINQDMKDFLNQQGSNTANNAMNSQSKQFLTGLKDTLKNNIPQSNMGNAGKAATNNFTDKWDAANKAHQDLQEFYKSPQPGSGVLRPVRQTREAFQAAQNGQPLDAAIIGKYMPRQNQTGTAGLDQLAKMYGSKSQAQEAAKSYINKRPLTNGTSTLDVSNEYAKLSPSQRDWIYGDRKEGDLLKAVNDTRQAFGKEPSRSLLTAGTHHALSLGAPAALGYFGSELAGGDREQNLLTAASLMGGAGIGKLLARRLSPESVQSLVKYAQRSPSNYGRYFNMPLQTAASGIYGGRNQ